MTPLKLIEMAGGMDVYPQIMIFEDQIILDI